MKYYVEVDNSLLEIDFQEQGEQLAVTIGDRKSVVDLRPISEPSLFSLIVDNKSYEVFVEPDGGEYDVLLGGEHFRLKVQDEWARRLATIQRKNFVAEGHLEIKAPMPGVVLSVEVAAGDEVRRGQGLVILGAMKMENEIKAPRAGVIQSVSVQTGQTVEQGRVLVTIR